MKKIGVICDWDDLLVPTHKMWLEANQQTVRKYDGVISEEKFIEIVSGTDVVRLLEAAGLHPSLASVIQQERNDLYGTLLQRATWMEGAEDFLLELQSRSIRMGVVSHARKQNIRALEHLGHKRFFPEKAFLCQDELGEKKKPHPFGLLKVASELHVEPSHSLFIGDMESDREAADRAGMKSMVIPSKLTKAGVPEKAWRTFPNLIECRLQMDVWLAELSK